MRAPGSRYARCARVRGEAKNRDLLSLRYQLDVVLVDEDGLVLGSWRELPAGRVVRCAGARHALERPSCGEPWPVVGDRVELRNMWHVMGA